MQENNFEKAVQQKLDDFSLTPSAPVWQKVEMAIKKKRERRLVFWLLPFLLITGALVLWQAGTWQTKKPAQQAQEKMAATPRFSKPHASNFEQKANTDNTTPNNQIVAHKSAPLTNLTAETNAKERNENKNKSTLKNKVLAHAETPETASTKSIYTDKKSEKKGIVYPHDVITDQQFSYRITAIKTDERITRNALPEVPVLKTVVLQNDTVQATVRLTPVATWKWRAFGRIGTSNMKEQLLSLSGLKSLRNGNLEYSANDPTQNNNGGAQGDTTSRKAPATPTKGLQFAIGLLVKKDLSRKTTFITGLQYGFYSNHLSVGSQVPADSVIATPNSGNADFFSLSKAKIFRNNGTHNSFTNRFHFIELPVGLEHRFLKNDALHLQYGFVFSRLLKADVLQYDATANVYYQGNSGLRKTGFNFFAAAGYTLWKGKSFSLQAGPYLQYGLRESFTNTQGNHLLSTGLGIYMGF